MSEIDKLYENAGIELIEGLEWVCQNPDHCVYQNLSVTPENCIGCEHFEREMRYPPFTAEKQIELIKWLSNNDKDKNKELTLCNSAHPYYYFGLHHKPAHSEDDMWGYGEGLGITFEEGLAKLINNLWQDLTEEEKQQIKEILK